MNAAKTIAKTFSWLGVPLGAFGRGIMAGWQNNWEGHEQNRRRARPSAWLSSQDVTLDFGDREKMGAEARVLFQTFPIVRRIARQYANYCVGNCRVQWNTGDENIDRLYEENWMNAMNILDINGVHKFPKLVKLAITEMIVFGDVFGQFRDEKGFLKLRLIEGDRVTNANGGTFNLDTDKIIGGIEIDEMGRPLFAIVCDRTRYGTFKNPKKLPYSELLHLMDSNRVDALRGVTAYHSVLNTSRDVKEIFDAEKTSVKVDSKLTILMKTLLGKGNGSGVNLFENEDTTEGTAKNDRQEIDDGMIAYMFPGEDIKSHKSDRPSPAWQGFVANLFQQIAVGLDLPVGVVWSMAGTGPAVRFDINQAGRTFAATQDLVESKFINPVVAKQTMFDINKKRLPFHPNWNRFKVQRPPYISIDLGRESKMGIEEYKARLLTGKTWFAEAGRDAYEEWEEFGREERFKRKVERDNGLPPGHLDPLGPNGPTEKPEDKDKKPPKDKEEDEE